MLKTFTTCTVLICTTGINAIAHSASSAEVIQPMKLCVANSNCSFGERDANGATLFKIKSQHHVAFIRCDSAGKCWQMFPKKGAVPVTDLTSVFARK